MKNPITAIIDRIFGRKYYAVIIGRQGSGIYEIASTIHRSRHSADTHRQQIQLTRTFIYIQTISFRSRNDFTLNTSRYPHHHKNTSS